LNSIIILNCLGQFYLTPDFARCLNLAWVMLFAANNGAARRLARGGGLAVAAPHSIVAVPLLEYQLPLVSNRLRNRNREFLTLAIVDELASDRRVKSSQPVGLRRKSKIDPFSPFVLDANYSQFNFILSAPNSIAIVFQLVFKDFLQKYI
jgi:hypothetical protein